MEVKIICFDADDTLWVNEPYYREAERAFCNILTNYISEEEANIILYKIEMENLDLYGYGAKAFMLSLIETAINISGGKIPSNEILKIIDIGKELLHKPIELLEGVEHVLNNISGKYKLIIATTRRPFGSGKKTQKIGTGEIFSSYRNYER